MREALAAQFSDPLAVAVAMVWAVAAWFGTWALVTWLGRFAGGYRSSYLADAERRLDEMFLDIPAERILRISIGCAAAGFLGGFLGSGGFLGWTAAARGLGIGVALGLLGFALPRLVLARLRARRVRAFNAQLVDALMTMGNALRAGFSVRQAFEMVVSEAGPPIAQEFGLLLQQTRMGVAFEESLNALSRRVGSDDLDLMIVAIQTSRQTGGNVTEVFDRLASTIRERSRVAGRLRSLTAQGRLQAAVVGLMPAVLAVALTVIDPPLMSGFVRSGTGLMLCGVVVVLEILGFLVIRRIVSIDL